jgi:hypothetical protein
MVNIEGQRLFTIFSLLFVIILFIFNITKIRVTARFIAAIISLLILMVYITSITLINNTNFILSDFIELSRPFVYFLFFLVPFFLPLNDNQLSNLIQFFIKNMVIMVFFSALVYIPISYSFIDFFKGRTHLAFSQFLRFSGTFGFPTLYSSYTVYALAMILIFILINKKIPNIGRLTFIIIVLFLGLLLSASRTGLLFAASILVLFVLIFFRNFSKIRKQVFPILFFIFIVSFLFINLQVFQLYTSYIFNSLSFFEGETTDTISFRINEISNMYTIAIGNFPFGIGTNEIYFSQFSSIESFYGQYLGRYGFFGLGIILWFFIHLINRSYKLIKLRGIFHKDYIYAFFITYFLWTLSFLLLAGWFHAPTDQFKGANLFYLFSGIIYFYPKKDLKNNEKTYDS